jgi:hypothetical protein
MTREKEIKTRDKEISTRDKEPVTGVKGALNQNASLPPV